MCGLCEAEATAAANRTAAPRPANNRGQGAPSLVVASRGLSRQRVHSGPCSFILVHGCEPQSVSPAATQEEGSMGKSFSRILAPTVALATIGNVRYEQVRNGLLAGFDQMGLFGHLRCGIRQAAMDAQAI